MIFWKIRAALSPSESLSGTVSLGFIENSHVIVYTFCALGSGACDLFGSFHLIILPMLRPAISKPLFCICRCEVWSSFASDGGRKLLDMFPCVSFVEGPACFAFSAGCSLVLGGSSCVSSIRDSVSGESAWCGCLLSFVIACLIWVATSLNPSASQMVMCAAFSRPLSVRISFPGVHRMSLRSVHV